jgi:hypothetical protein
MKKMLVALSAVAALALGAGSVSAQTFSPLSGTGSINGTLSLQQTLPFPISCSLNPIPVLVSSTGTSATTTLTSFPHSLCSGFGSLVTANSNWTITPISSTQVQISGITANAFNGTCGSGTIVADVVDPGPALVLVIQRQSIPGNPVECWIEGEVEVSGISLS